MTKKEKAVFGMIIRGISTLVKNVEIKDNLIKINIEFIENELLRELFQDYVFNIVNQYLLIELNKSIENYYKIESECITILFE